MRIMQIIPGFWVGGAEVMCKNLVLSLQEQGHQVSVVCLYNERTDLSREIESAGVTVHYLDKQLGLDLSMVPKLRAILRQERPEAVHTHLDVIKYAVAAAKLAGVKVCVHTMHSLAHKEAEGRLQKIINTIYFRLGWSVPVALTQEVQSSISDFYGLPKEKIPEIRNGIDLSRCQPKESYAAGEIFQLLHVGRFDAPKNHAGMLEAFAQLRKLHPNCHLTLVGDGDLRAQIEADIARLGLKDAVTLAGMQKDVYPYLHNADAFILPSVYEGSPMSIIEAMGTGLPIAASRVGGIPNMLRDGQSGLLHGCEPEEICAAWQKLLEEEALRAQLGTKAREESTRFSSGHMARAYSEIYSKG